MSTESVRHASRESQGSTALCGRDVGGREHRMTRPKELVNCPDCRVVLNHVRKQYPEQGGSYYGDWRLKPESEKKAARDMLADMYGGADD